jgi:tRNA threonylcarbamoyladenosine biosynthesis protein TsaE
MLPLHALILETRTLHWPDEATCAADAAALSQHPLMRNALLTLRGPLGAGKTTFVRHLLRALGVTGRIKSPSYAVVEPHQGSGGLVISHFDFYRFNDPRELAEAGLRDLLAAPGLKLCEWPDQAAGQLPTPDLALDIDFDTTPADSTDEADPARRVTVIAGTAVGQTLLRAWAAAQPVPA